MDQGKGTRVSPLSSLIAKTCSHANFISRGAFDFFTYGELLWWFFFTLVINPFRWKWALFVIFGIGSALPMNIVRQERRFGRDPVVRQKRTSFD
jgi:hypothetical protein